jgi:hypothetical protein
VCVASRVGSHRRACRARGVGGGEVEWVGGNVGGRLAHDLAEAGKTAGAGVLAGVAIIGGLLGSGVTSSGQIAR